MKLPTLPVIEYCERSNAAFWAEPFNAVSNLAFILVAVLLMRRVQQQRIADTDIRLLIILTGLIGIGSFLWHTLAVGWALWLDIIPIFLYMSLYLVSFLYRIRQLQLPVTLLCLLGFYLVHLGLYLWVPVETLNGSVFYIPSVLLLMFFTCYVRRLRIAVILFVIGIVLRSSDQWLCNYITIGSHFLWHVSISLVVFYSSLTLIENSRGRRGLLFN